MNGSFKGSDEDVEASVSVSNNINYLEIKKLFYYGNMYTMVAVDNQNDMYKLINLETEGVPHFISCSDLNRSGTLHHNNFNSHTRVSQK